MNNKEYLDYHLDMWGELWVAKYYPDDYEPEYSEGLIKEFNPRELGLPPAENLRTEEQVKDKLNILFRELQNLEIYDWAVYAPGFETWRPREDCSDKTNELIEVYEEYNKRYGPGTNLEWFEKQPFLTRTIDWLQEQ